MSPQDETRVEKGRASLANSRRVQAERIREAHQAAMEAGEAGYADPLSGNFVFTALALYEQGYCCGAGCRHCPWGNGPDG